MLGFQLAMFMMGLVLLVWGSSLFVDSAVALANYLNLPEVLIGATIVSLGTTLPELLFSSMASVRGLTDMALGNALGSVLCNTGFIAGLLILLKPVSLNEKEVQNVITGTLFLGVSFSVHFLGGVLCGGLTRFTGTALLLLFVLYFRNTVFFPAKRKAVPRTVSSETRQQKGLPAKNRQTFGVSDILRLALEVTALYLGSSILVKFGPMLARSLGVPEVIISLSLVALGTSLPELVTSLMSLKKNHSSLSLGNIIGANVLNFLLVDGVCAVIRPIPYPPSILKLELPFIFLMLSLLCIPSFLQHRAGRIQGALLLVSYGMYLVLMSS